MIRQYELVEKVRAYDPGADEELLNRAYVFSMKAHGSQKRASGDPYFSHPLEVAGILTDYKLDGASIVTALLHDTVEDTLATLPEIEQAFGPEVAKLVDGVTKLSRIELASDEEKQAENFRKLLVATATDIRVLLVKLADRLHNMRTLHFLQNEEKRRRIARETMELYAPLAERIGMRRIKDELEDLSFREINPEARASVAARLEFLHQRGGELPTRIVDELRRTLAEAGIEVWISGREKSPYSIWTKMERKNVSFEQLSDVMAFRIVVATPADCYRALGVVHGKYPMVPGRFKDYISTPKRNGYKSLHSSVIGPERQRIEVQLRTRDMHDVAEYGVAAHWRYKQAEDGTSGGAAETQSFEWLRDIMQILEHSSGPEDFLRHAKLDLFADQVFSFTPKGRLIALPRGATAVDFAYAVHTEVGDTCVGAKVNGRLVPLRTQLQNGDQVEIVRSKAQTPSPAWETFVVTGKARSAIKRFIRQQQRNQYQTLGRAIAERAFKGKGHELTDKAVEGVLKMLKLKSVEEVYEALGEGELTPKALIDAVFPGDRLIDRLKGVIRLPRRRQTPTADGDKVQIRGLIPGMAMHLAECCHPLPGDRIVGIVTPGKGVTIHTIDCDQLEQHQSDHDRWLDVTWGDSAELPEFHVARLHVLVANQPGGLAALCTVIAKNLANISNLRITKRAADFFDVIVDVEVRDVKHMTGIIAALRASPVISSVERQRGAGGEEEAPAPPPEKRIEKRKEQGA
jgi:GTP diphosphokinase / guanosine-3',5'-bis(diphosphate) 3'-diphosphatase